MIYIKYYQIVEIDGHIACAFSGLTADSKTLIDKARYNSFFKKYKLIYKVARQIPHCIQYWGVIL